MKKKQVSPLWQIFLIAIVFLAFIEIAQAFRIRALYLSSQQRAFAMHTLDRIADEQGWLLSDISLLRVDRRQMQFLHKTHHRGYDESVCYYARYSESSPPIPCNVF